MEPLEKYVKNLPGGKMLDAATGHGCFVKILAKSFKSYEQIIAIDLDPERLTKIEEESKLENVSFKAMNLDQLDFKNDYFDTVAIRFSVHHLTNINQALSEMKRVLKPGGLFIICEMYRDNQNPKQENYTNLHHWWAEVDRVRNVPHYPTLLRNEMISHFDNLQLQSVKYVDHDFPSEDEDSDDYEELDKIFNQYVDIVRQYPGNDDLISKGQQILTTIKEGGMEPPSALFLFGRK